MFGPDVASLYLSIVLIAGPALLFCYQVMLKIHKHKVFHQEGISDERHILGLPVLIVAMVIMLLDLAFLILTSSRDPGIIPRNAYPPDSYEAVDFNTPSIDWTSGQTPHLGSTPKKEVIVNGFIVKVKYCHTCLLYRPPRASHCAICDNCVQKFDHHCPWVGQCIGLRNYRFYLLFISTSTFLCIYVFIFSLLNILEERIIYHKSLLKCVTGEIFSLILIIYTFISVWFVGGLTGFHSYLVSKNQTTYENFRYRYDKKENPFNKGFWGNIKDVFFKTIPPSMNEFRSWVSEETYKIGSFTPDIGLEVDNSKEKFDIEMGIKNSSIVQIWDNRSTDSNLEEKSMNKESSLDNFVFPVSQEPSVQLTRDCNDSNRGEEGQDVDESVDKEAESTLLDESDDRKSCSSEISAPVDHDVQMLKT